VPDPLTLPELPEVPVTTLPPVPPPLLVLLVVAAPELPDVVLPEAEDFAAPVFPPVPDPLTLPELPEVPVTTLPPVPPPLPPPPPPDPELPLALPDEPEPPFTAPPPATPVTEVLVGELTALPELPECDEPVAELVLEPLELVLEEVPDEVELPDEPPFPVLWESDDPVAVPPEPEPPSAWAFAAAACICAAMTSSTIIASLDLGLGRKVAAGVVREVSERSVTAPLRRACSVVGGELLLGGAGGAVQLCCSVVLFSCGLGSPVRWTAIVSAGARAPSWTVGGDGPRPAVNVWTGGGAESRRWRPARRRRGKEGASRPCRLRAGPRSGQG
jgi:hypothetical protein